MTVLLVVTYYTVVLVVVPPICSADRRYTYIYMCMNIFRLQCQYDVLGNYSNMTVLLVVTYYTVLVVSPRHIANRQSTPSEEHVTKSVPSMSTMRGRLATYHALQLTGTANMARQHNEGNTRQVHNPIHTSSIRKSTDPRHNRMATKRRRHILP